MKGLRLKMMGIVGLFVLVGFLGACATFQCGQRGPKIDDLSGATLWESLDTMNYTGWKMWPGKDALYKGTQPHGAFLTTYVNESAHAAIMGKKGGMPEGAIVVKENYSPQKELAAVTVMYKVKGYNPSVGDWFWAMKTAR